MVVGISSINSMECVFFYEVSIGQKYQEDFSADSEKVDSTSNSLFVYLFLLGLKIRFNISPLYFV